MWVCGLDFLQLAVTIRAGVSGAVGWWCCLLGGINADPKPHILRSLRLPACTKDPDAAISRPLMCEGGPVWALTTGRVENPEVGCQSTPAVHVSGRSRVVVWTRCVSRDGVAPMSRGSQEGSSGIWMSLRWTQMFLSIHCLCFWCLCVRVRAWGSCPGSSAAAQGWVSRRSSHPHAALWGPAVEERVGEDSTSSCPPCCYCCWDLEPACCCYGVLWHRVPVAAGIQTGWISSGETMRRRGSVSMMLRRRSPLLQALLPHPPTGFQSLCPHSLRARPSPSLLPARWAPLPSPLGPAPPHPLWVSAPSLACLHTRPVVQSHAIALFDFSWSLLRLWRTRPGTSAM